MPEGYRKSVLPNGIRLVTEAMPHVRSVAVGVWVDTGSRVEPEERGGISHLIEHLVFKGTATRSAEAIARAIDSVGGHMDAFTAKEHTCFYVGVLDEHLPLAVDLLSDILMRPLFAAEDIEKEKSVVLQEIKMVEDTPDDLIHDLFAERVWAGHPLGRPILGLWERVKAFDRSTILRHFEEEYVPGRITVAVAGHVEHDQVRDLFASRFAGFERTPTPRTVTPPTLHPGPAHGHQAPRAGPHRAGLSRHLRRRPRALRAVFAQRRDRGQHVLPPLPGGAGAPGPRVLRALGHPALPGYRPPLRLRGDGAGELRQGAPRRS